MAYCDNPVFCLKGEFYSIKTHTEPPFVAQPFTLPEQPDQMLSVGISEFTLNSASYGYFSAGQLQALINDSMVGGETHRPKRVLYFGLFRFVLQRCLVFSDSSSISCAPEHQLHGSVYSSGKRISLFHKLVKQFI